jgi:AcrR family transcriptional regulator
MSKGDDTRSHILRQALDLSSEVGFEGLTIGALAKRVKMSKSGLYAHFESKEALQGQVLGLAGEHFVDVVVRRAITEPRGLPRIRTLFGRWLGWATVELSGGCPFIAAATEYDDRPGPVRDKLVAQQDEVLEIIARAARIAVDEGHLRAELDTDQFAFEFWAILQAYHHFARLLRRDDARARAEGAFESLIRNAGAT